MSELNYHFFLDETGDHGLSFIDRNFPLFLLCGCIIDQDNLEKIEREINNFKERHFNTTRVILHSRDIRKCEGAFQILFDLNVKKGFYEDLNRILKESQYCLIGSAIHKEEHIKRYGKRASDPYALSLSFLIERVLFYLNRKSDNYKVEIVAEERGKREDKELLSHFNSVMDQGTYYIDSIQLKQRIKRLRFHNKRDNIIGLQVADLCAYPLARHVLNPKEPYIPFEVIKEKIDCDDKGKYLGWGLKIFP